MTPSTSLDGKVVLITGAGRRVGACIAAHVHGRGARVVVHYRNSATEAKALVDRLNDVRADSAMLARADLADVAQIDALPPLIEAIVGHFGQLDAVVNNASSFYPTALGQIGADDWNSLVGSNFMAPLFLAQAAAPALKKSRGCIVNMTDIHAERPLKGYPLYCAAKGALLTLTRALALELAPEVRVNAVAPGPILWPEDGSFDRDERSAIVAHTLLQRAGTPQDIASTVGFLLAEAPYITGQVINVDGGRTAHL